MSTIPPPSTIRRRTILQTLGFVLGIATLCGASVGIGACAGAGPIQLAHPFSADEPVIIYGAAWCPHTREAEAYFASQNIPYELRDVDRNFRDRDQMEIKAGRAGIDPTRIPLIDMRGRLESGFDRAEAERILRSLD